MKRHEIECPQLTPHFLMSQLWEFKATQLVMNTSIHRIFFSTIILHVSGKGMMAIMDQDPELLVLGIGRLSVNVLTPSELAARVNDEHHLLWRKLVKSFGKLAKTGVNWVNLLTGHRAKVRDMRFSVGAENLYKNGVRLLARSVNCIYEIEQNRRYFFKGNG